MSHVTSRTIKNFAVRTSYCRSAKIVIETFFFARPILVQLNSIEKLSTDRQLWHHQFIVVTATFLRMTSEGINELKF